MHPEAFSYAIAGMSRLSYGPLGSRAEMTTLFKLVPLQSLHRNFRCQAFFLNIFKMLMRRVDCTQTQRR